MFTPVALARAAPVAAPPANAPSPATRAQLTLVVGTVLSPPHVVLGADNRQHLAHELQLLNTAPFPIKLKRLDTIDPATGAVLQSLRGAGLAALVKRPEGAPFDGTLGAGLSGIVILDAMLPKNAPLPANLTHRITLGFTPPPGFPALPKVYTLGRTPVGQDRPMVIGRPLRGARWVAVNGCCDALTAHLNATLGSGDQQILAQVPGIRKHRMPEFQLRLVWINCRGSPKLSMARYYMTVEQTVFVCEVK